MKKKAKLYAFQSDLQNGMTIEEALQKHELTFREAVEQMPRPKLHDKSSTGERYITHNRYGYHVRKKVNGKTRHFGVYPTLKEAVRVRDYCIKYGWHWRQLKSIQKKCGVKQE